MGIALCGPHATAAFQIRNGLACGRRSAQIADSSRLLPDRYVLRRVRAHEAARSRSAEPAAHHSLGTLTQEHGRPEARCDGAGCASRRCDGGRKLERPPHGSGGIRGAAPATSSSADGGCALREGARWLLEWRCCLSWTLLAEAAVTRQPRKVGGVVCRVSASW